MSVSIAPVTVITNSIHDFSCIWLISTPNFYRLNLCFLQYPLHEILHSVSNLKKKDKLQSLIFKCNFFFCLIKNFFKTKLFITMVSLIYITPIYIITLVGNPSNFFSPFLFCHSCRTSFLFTTVLFLAFL